MKRSNTKEFIEKAKAIHGDRYDYSLVEYKNSQNKVKIICNKTKKTFEQKPNGHLNGRGCNCCRYERSAKSNSDTQETWIEKAKAIHGDRYDYSLVEYKKSQNKINIICPIHGVFKQRPQDHLRFGCNKCGYDKVARNNIKLSIKEFIKKAKAIHGDRYDYSLVEYNGGNKKIKIICPIHGIFEQIANDHLRGHGCQYCKASVGEEKIAKFLRMNAIAFERQKTFEECVSKNKLRFDFYLPKHNVIIEYDGIQHFKAIEYFGGRDGLKQSKIRDKIKDIYCIQNDINLIRISYKQDIHKKLEYIKEFIL